VLSHGWLLSADSWEAQMLFLAARGYRCVAHDRRGYGRSSQPWNGNDMDTEIPKAKDRPPSPALLNRYDRERLYAEVWSEPTQKVARRYGMSDVALAQVCAQLSVPKPPRGYWAKKAAGVTTPRAPKLPP
jgi:cephalosporin-C deacetylase-like acetyl esterase